MWLPTNISRFIARAALACLTLLTLAACGYGFGADSESVIKPTTEGALPTLKIKSVDNPTLHTWIAHIVRAEMRDEIAARGLARWVDSGKADYEISFKVDSFTFRSWLTDSDDVTMLYSAAMTMEAILYKGNTNEEVWRSGKTSYSQSYERVQERTAASDLTRELARRIASNLQHSF